MIAYGVPGLIVNHKIKGTKYTYVRMTHIKIRSSIILRSSARKIKKIKKNVVNIRVVWKTSSYNQASCLTISLMRPLEQQLTFAVRMMV